MLAGTAFFFLRILQIITLIPTWGMLAYFVDQHTKANAATPGSILCLFIVALLATIWALVTLFTFLGPRFTDLWVAIGDLIFFGIMIAGVVMIAPLADNTDCVQGYANNGSWGVTWQKSCMMYKACWAFGILNIILFFITAVLAALIWHRGKSVAYADRPRRRFF